MSTTVYTEDGTFTWLDDYDNEEVEQHGHQSGDIPVPLTLQKDLTSSQRYIECKTSGGTTLFEVDANGNATCEAVVQRHDGTGG